ncbi:Uma2 family endonuclease [Scytonema sp. NUACC26]|uniref:Uma2 family endonuclease n=1 Tax=Scytonema sp. NUACC26 TaxID=3140176 RepID=UPI0034DC816C
MSVSTQNDAIDFQQIPAVPTEPIWRFSIEQYHQMICQGILTEDDPVELLEGWLIPKMPKNPPHRVATKLTRNILEKLVPDGWYVDTQEPITLDNSEPEPDVVIVRGDTRDYLDRHPGAKDIALVVEVSDSTLERDKLGTACASRRTLKKRIYARANIPVYWIVNLVEQQVEVYTEPTNLLQEPTYQQRHDYQITETIPLVIEGVEVGRASVQNLLP